MSVLSIGRSAAWLILLGWGAATAATKPQAPSSIVVAYTLQISASNQPPRSMDQKIWMKGKKFRVEMALPNGKQLTVGNPTGIYMMMPGMNGAMKLPAELAAQAAPQETLVGGLSRIRSQKKVGSEKVGRYETDIYETKGPSPVPGAEPGATATTRVWVSKALPIPVKVVTRMPPHFESVQTLRSVTLNGPVSEALFQLPKGTKIHKEPAPPKGGHGNAPGGG
jgi:outer membrane lipoprotein-sorting protein